MNMSGIYLKESVLMQIQRLCWRIRRLADISVRIKMYFSRTCCLMNCIKNIKSYEKPEVTVSGFMALTWQIWDGHFDVRSCLFSSGAVALSAPLCLWQALKNTEKKSPIFTGIETRDICCHLNNILLSDICYTVWHWN